MKLVALTVSRLPGVEEPFSVRELSPHVTVVVGPNASGKSSLVRALRSLFNPGVHAGQPVDVVGEFRQGLADGQEVAWRATRVGSVISWERDGARADPPATPPDHLLNSYLVSIETLMQSGSTDSTIGELLRKEMTGGYDLPAALRAVTPAVAGHRRAANEYRRAARELEELQREQQRLHERQSQRSDLVLRRERAAELAAELPRYQRAVGLRSQRAELATERERLAGMPAQLAELTGREADELVSLRDDLVAADERRERAERRLVAANAALAETGLAEAEVDEAAAHELQAAAEELTALAEKVADIRRQEAERSAELRAPWRRLGGSPKGPAPEAFDAQALDEAELLLGERLAAAVAVDAAEEELLALRAREREERSERLEQPERLDQPEREDSRAHGHADTQLADNDLASATTHLANWLAALPQTPPPRALLGPGLLLLAAACLFLFTTVTSLRGGSADGLIALATAAGAAFYVPMALGLVLTVAGSIWLFVSAQGRGPVPDRTESDTTGAGAEVARSGSGLVLGTDAELAARAFLRTGAKPPERWTHEQVADRLQQLMTVSTARRAQEAARTVLAGRMEAASRRLEGASARLAVAEERLAELAAKTGYAAASTAPLAGAASGPSLLGAGFSAWLRDARQVNDLTSRLRGLAGARRELERQADDAYARILRGLAGTPFELEEPVTEKAVWREGAWRGSKLPHAQAALTCTRRLLRAVTERDRTLADSARARAELEEATAALASAAAKRTALLARCGVDDAATDVDAQVHALLAARPAYRAALKRVSELEALVADAESQLAGAPHILAAALAGDVAVLEGGAKNAEQAVTEQHDLSVQLGALDEQVRAAEQGRDLERARLRVERTGREVEANLRQAHLNAAAELLFEDVEQEHNVKRQPDVLLRAQEWFARFTHGAFELVFQPAGADDERLRARDVASGRLLSPAELSTGTRAQLLLALRVSHATHAEEGGMKLPFFLDEALTTADAGRFAEVAASLLELSAGDGRQVIYLSARKDDAAAWRRVAEAGPGGQLVKVIDLADVRTLGASVSW